MKSISNTKAQLTDEVRSLRQKIAELEARVTVGKQAEGKLKESEEGYRKLIEISPHAIFVHIDQKIIFMNPAGLELLGAHNSSEVIGKSILDLTHPDYWEVVKRRQELLKKGEAPPHEYIKALRLDGSVRDIELTTARVTYQGESAIMSTTRDITDRLKAEGKLKESEEGYRKLIETSPYAIFVHVDQKIIFMNPAGLELLGAHNSSEVIGKSIFDFTHPDSLEVIKRRQELLKKGDAPPHEYFKAIRLDGSVIDVEVAAARRVTYQGKSAIMATLHDITDRLKAEEALVKSEERYRTLYESIKEGIGLADMEGNILDANQAFLDMLGYRIEEIRKLSYYDLTPKKWHKITKDLIKNQTMVRGYSKEYEKEYIKKDGTTLPITIRSWLTKDKQGKPIGTWAIMRDITERKTAEEKLLKKQYYLTKAQEMGIIGTWELDIQKNILIWTDENYKIFGVPPGTEMNYELFLNCIHPDDRDYVNEKWSAGLNHEPYDIEHRLIVNDKLKWVREKADIEFDKEGNPIMAIGFTQDITERKKSEERLKKTMDATIKTVSKIIEAKDPYTSGHQQRVYQLAVPLARELGLSEDKIEGIKIATLIHDIGKISIPTEILSKPTKLTDMEFNLIKDHSQTGSDILKSIDFSYPIARIVLQHHERLNGTGYPNNLKGDKILLEAKIIGVADVVEAMSSHRPYRPALGIDAALEEISKNKGTLYDPEVVDACLKLFKEKGFKFK